MGKSQSVRVPSEVYFYAEPRGVSYTRLIQLALECCNVFSLVWHDDRKVKELNNDLIQKLEPYLVSDVFTNTWPGTEGSKKSANVCTYRLNDQTASLLEVVNGLYGWVAPKKPEDIAFYLESGEIWLGTVAHEHMGWLVTETIVRADKKRILSFLYSNGIINRKYEV